MDVTCAPAETVVWHDLECGAYAADQGLWLELAERARERHGDAAAVLDIGAGSGRVALALARAGYAVTAVEIDPALAGALSERAAGLPVQVVQADARTLDLGHERFGLALVPMQTLQLLLPARERLALMDAARAHLLPDGRLACAIATDLESFEGHDLAPAPETVRVGPRTFSSRAVRVARERGEIVLEREREITQAGEAPVRSLDVQRLARLTVARVEAEGEAVGLIPSEIAEVPATDEHSGSMVVIFDA